MSIAREIIKVWTQALMRRAGQVQYGVKKQPEDSRVYK